MVEQIPPNGVNSSPVWRPETDADREAVREQVGRILASSLFRNSKRFPTLLHYTVECALKGNADSPKERTLGMEVFGRKPDYDTAKDPVVRMTAVEIRKRLAQYYQTPGHEDEIRIMFPPGYYLPEFHLPPEPAPIMEPPPVASPAVHRPRAYLLAGLAVLCVLAGALVWWRAWASEAAFDRFWNPVLKSGAPVLVCVGDDPNLSSPDGVTPITREVQVTGETTVGDVLRRDTVRYSNALTLAMLAGFLGSRDQTFRVRRTAGMALHDLRDGPVVLIGLAENRSTLRLGDQLRFSFTLEGGRLFIRDRQNPLSQSWGYDGLNAPLAKTPDAHGIISRVMDPTTGHFMVTAAGLLWGTRAAGECLVDPGCMDAAARRAPGDWTHKNIQIVVSTEVIGENSGPPRVLAVHLW